MGDVPNAHLWYGTRVTEDHPWCVHYKNGQVVPPAEDLRSAEIRIGASGAARVVDLSNSHGHSMVALATTLYLADWDGELEIGTLTTPSSAAIESLLSVAKFEGWANITADDLAWRLGASCNV